MIQVLRGMVRSELIDFKRYWLNATSGIVTLYAIFLLIFFGMRSFVAGPTLGDETTSLIVSYWMITLTMLAFEAAGWYLSNQAQVGTLEQLYLSPYGPGIVLFGKMVAGIVFSLIFNIPFLFMLMLTTGRWLNLDIVSMLPFVLFALLQGFGIGLGMGGLVLIHKRISGMFQVMYMAFIAFVATPPDVSPLVRLMPLNQNWRLLRNVMGDGMRLWELPLGDVAYVALQTAVILLLGFGGYKLCERYAKEHGRLGQY